MIDRNKLLTIINFNLQYQEEIDKALISAASYNKTEANIHDLCNKPISAFKEYELKDILEVYEMNGFKYKIYEDYFTIYWEIDFYNNKKGD